jgi:hypothetical protein
VASALRPLDSQKDLEDLSLFAEKGRNEVLGRRTREAKRATLRRQKEENKMIHFVNSLILHQADCEEHSKCSFLCFLFVLHSRIENTSIDL